MGNVDEVAELRLPQHQRLGIIAAVAVFETQNARFGQCRVVNFATRLRLRDVLERHVLLLIFDIHQDGVALVEGAAAGVLSAESHRNPVPYQAAESQRFRHAVVERTLARAHLGALLQQLFNLGMDVEASRIRGQAM